jgi:hypothetical protein
MSLVRELVSRIDELEKRIDRLSDVEIVPFNIGTRLFNSAGITISHDTVTNLTFNTERFDTDNMHSLSSNTERITINTPGKYLISGNVSWTANGTGIRLIYIRLKDTTFLSVVEIGVRA